MGTMAIIGTIAIPMAINMGVEAPGRSICGALFDRVSASVISFAAAAPNIPSQAAGPLACSHDRSICWKCSSGNGLYRVRYHLFLKGCQWPVWTEQQGAGGICLRLPLYVMELFVSQAMQRYRITANWARLAVPAGFRVPAVVPLRIPSATAQAMASVA